MPFAQVALPLPLRRTFTYRVPEGREAEVVPGVQVEVPFRNRRLRGFVVSVSAASEVESPRLLGPVLGPRLLSTHLLDLAAWIADYYLAPPGEVLAAALPGGLEGFARSRARGGAAAEPGAALPLPERFTLSAPQRAALEAVEEGLAARRFAAFLLHGVTASGKTEIYARGALRARDLGGQALVLVPEVALTSQLVAEFRRRFGTRVGVLHSYLSVGERRRTWELAQRGALDVVLGARSAVFAPLPDLRLVVVDEEHEPAYKQSEQLRYHARDVAVKRAQLLGAVAVLGSATPSLESYANAARGKYRRLVLAERVVRRPLPEVHIVDLRHEPPGALLSSPLRHALARRLRAGEQTLLFLNRRGHSHVVQCRACGFVPECPGCDISLTYHLATHDLRCHYCGHEEPTRRACPQCGSDLFRFAGAGTQRAEQELATLFPGARVLRLDRDVAGGRRAPEAVLESFARHEADVLLGTQMVAKGLDFPEVTLVGVLDADVALHLPDFRAAERTFQLLMQVAGRAGRGRRRGEVFVQTLAPEHPAVSAALGHDYAGFAERELGERREADYPPYKRLVALRFTGPEQAAVERVAESVAARARGALPEGVELLGPAPQPIARLRNLHRWHLLLRGSSAAKVRSAAREALDWAEGEGLDRKVRVGADVDPVEVL
jgi:primosomal protein N' (replication factor Y)